MTENRTFDDATLIELSRTEAGREALKIAMAIEADAEALSLGVADAFESTTRVPHHDRSRRRVHATGRVRVVRWAALAAAVAFGFTLMLKQAPNGAPQAPVAAEAAPVIDDRILAGDFEAAPHASAGESKDALFVDDFGA